MPSLINANITLRDVAEAAGVSVSTASRALNGHAKTYRISDKTEQTVCRVADRLGFQASQTARTLRLRRSGLIGVTVPNLSNPFFAAIAREATLVAEAEGYSVLLADSRETSPNEQRLMQALLARDVEALIVCPVGLEAGHLVDADESGLPIVIVDRGFGNANLLTVTSDHAKGAGRGAKMLVRNGHRVIGVLQGLPGTLPNEQRLSGFKQVLDSAGIPFNGKLVAGDNFTEESGYESARRLLTARPDITAFFAMSTPNALGALRVVAELGLSVPADVSMVTFDDHPFAEFMEVRLSTVSQRVTELGRIAANLVIERLKTGKRKRKTMHIVPMDFVQRASIRDLRNNSSDPH